MPDLDKTIECLKACTGDTDDCAGHTCPYWDFDDSDVSCRTQMELDALAMLQEQESLLGIQQTADSITFVSTGTAQQGESRGILLGKLAMHEWLKKELLYRGLLTDDIRAVFDEAKRKEGR